MESAVCGWHGTHSFFCTGRWVSGREQGTYLVFSSPASRFLRLFSNSNRLFSLASRSRAFLRSSSSDSNSTLTFDTSRVVISSHDRISCVSFEFSVSKYLTRSMQAARRLFRFCSSCFSWMRLNRVGLSVAVLRLFSLFVLAVDSSGCGVFLAAPPFLPVLCDIVDALDLQTTHRYGYGGRDNRTALGIHIKARAAGHTIGSTRQQRRRRGRRFGSQ